MNHDMAGHSFQKKVMATRHPCHLNLGVLSTYELKSLIRNSTRRKI